MIEKYLLEASEKRSTFTTDLVNIYYPGNKSIKNKKNKKMSSSICEERNKFPVSRYGKSIDLTIVNGVIIYGRPVYMFL